MRTHPHSTEASLDAFSLIEVVLALGICTFGLISVLGLFTAGLKSNRESDSHIQACNLAAKMLSQRRMLPASTTDQMSAYGIPALNRAYGDAYSNGSSRTSLITASGYITQDRAKAAYVATCRAGTNTITGKSAAQVYLMLSWPALMDPSNPQSSHYEVLTSISLP